MSTKREGSYSRGTDRPSAKLDEEQVRAIRQRYSAEKMDALAAEYGVSKPAIHYVVTRKTWRHVA